MLRKFFGRTWPWATMGAVLGLFLLWAISFLFDLTQEKCSEAAAAYYGHCPRYNLAFVGLWNFLETTNWISPAITGVATALLTYVTVLLFRIEREGGETTRAQLRAYVSIVDSDIKNVSEGRAPVAYITMRNNGQTPAYEFFAAIGMTIGPHPIPEGVHLPNPLISAKDGKIHVSHIAVGLSGPNQKSHMKCELDIKLTKEILAELESGKRAIYVYGFAKYRDAFKRYWNFDYRHACGGAAAPSIEILYADKVTEDESDERTHRAMLALSGASADFPATPPSGKGDGLSPSK